MKIADFIFTLKLTFTSSWAPILWFSFWTHSRHAQILKKFGRFCCETSLSFAWNNRLHSGLWNNDCHTTLHGRHRIHFFPRLSCRTIYTNFFDSRRQGIFIRNDLFLIICLIFFSGTFSIIKYLIGVVKHTRATTEENNEPTAIKSVQMLISCYLCGWFIIGKIRMREISLDEVSLCCFYFPHTWCHDNQFINLTSDKGNLKIIVIIFKNCFK